MAAEFAADRSEDRGQVLVVTHVVDAAAARSRHAFQLADEGTGTEAAPVRARRLVVHQHEVDRNASAPGLFQALPEGGVGVLVVAVVEDDQGLAAAEALELVQCQGKRAPHRGAAPGPQRADAAAHRVQVVRGGADQPRFRAETDQERAVASRLQGVEKRGGGALDVRHAQEQAARGVDRQTEGQREIEGDPKRLELLGAVVLENGEVGSGEVAHGLSGTIRRDDVELHQFDTDPGREAGPVEEDDVLGDAAVEQLGLDPKEGLRVAHRHENLAAERLLPCSCRQPVLDEEAHFTQAAAARHLDLGGHVDATRLGPVLGFRDAHPECVRRLVDQQLMAVEFPVLGVEGDGLDPAEAVASPQVDPGPVWRPVAGRHAPAVVVEDDPLHPVGEPFQDLGDEGDATAAVGGILGLQVDRARQGTGFGFHRQVRQVDEVDQRIAPAPGREILGQHDRGVGTGREPEGPLEGQVLSVGRSEGLAVTRHDAAVLPVEAGADPPRCGLARRCAIGRHNRAGQASGRPFGRRGLDLDRGNDFDTAASALELAVEFALEGTPQPDLSHGGWRTRPGDHGRRAECAVFVSWSQLERTGGGGALGQLEPRLETAGKAVDPLRDLQAVREHRAPGGRGSAFPVGRLDEQCELLLDRLLPAGPRPVEPEREADRDLVRADVDTVVVFGREGHGRRRPAVGRRRAADGLEPRHAGCLHGERTGGRYEFQVVAQRIRGQTVAEQYQVPARRVHFAPFGVGVIRRRRGPEGRASQVLAVGQKGNEPVDLAAAHLCLVAKRVGRHLLERGFEVGVSCFSGTTRAALRTRDLELPLAGEQAPPFNQSARGFFADNESVQRGFGQFRIAGRRQDRASRGVRHDDLEAAGGQQGLEVPKQ